LDAALGLIDGCTPTAVRMFSRTAAQWPYLESSQQLQELAGLRVEPSRLQRLVGAVGPSLQEPLLHLRCALLSAGGWNHLWSQVLPRAA
jgi:hypothetical protein